MARYVLFIAMDFSSEALADLDEIWDEHQDFIRQVPGVVKAYRGEREDGWMRAGKETYTISAEESLPHFIAVYELEDSLVTQSEEWGTAVNQGRWANEIRPLAFNVRRFLLQVTSPDGGI